MHAKGNGQASLNFDLALLEFRGVRHLPAGLDQRLPTHSARFFHEARVGFDVLGATLTLRSNTSKSVRS